MSETTSVPPIEQLRLAGQVAVAAAGTLPTADLDAPTPCSGYTLRQLADHFAWGPLLLETSGLRKPFGSDWAMDAPAPYLAGLAPADWPAAFEAQMDRAVEVWSDPATWEGEADFAGSPMPAAMIGSMMLAEFATHGWDVARAAGAVVEVPPVLGESVLEATAGMAQMGRDGGWYGAEVPVDADAPAFSRALGLAGRDPSWTPAD